MLIDQAFVTKAPDTLTAVEAASVWMQYMTAYFPIVELAKAAPGRTILVPAGTSTAGNAALQIGRLCGATIVLDHPIGGQPPTPAEQRRGPCVRR